MKELSIEQKAKAYDKALARARKVHKYSSDLTEIKRMEDIFPILTESEDKKIRNFITNELACLRATDEKGSDRYEDLTNAIAWLEDQGKQKQKQYDIDILEKHITKDSISELAHTVIVRNGWEIVDAKEQKPIGWSEWDDKMVKIIDTLLMRASAGAGLGTIRCPYDDARDFIQSLKQRYGWKPSKEQIIALRWVLNNIPYNKYKEEISGLLEQIKNL